MREPEDTHVNICADVIHLFYHLYLGPAWQPIAREFADTVSVAAVPGLLTVGLVGSPAGREEARRLWPGASFTEADAAWEMLTLREMWRTAQSEPAAAMCYVHAKGTYHPGPHNAVWRRSMLLHLITGWQRCTDLLREVDAVGCHWYPGPNTGVPYAVFAGNFWWARAAYLRDLPEPPLDADPSYAERWVTFGNPRVADLRPGWPNASLFTQEERDAAERAELLRWGFIDA